MILHQGRARDLTTVGRTVYFPALNLSGGVSDIRHGWFRTTLYIRGRVVRVSRNATVVW